MDGGMVSSSGGNK
jgi:hypothetical protein